MARQTHEHQVGTGKYPILTDLDALTFLAADPVNFEETEYGDRLIIVARNVSADTAYDVTLTSVASSKTGRTGTLVKELAFGDQLIIGPLGADGWRQSDGTLHFAGENADIEFAVVRL